MTSQPREDTITDWRIAHWDARPRDPRPLGHPPWHELLIVHQVRRDLPLPDGHSWGNAAQECEVGGPAQAKIFWMDLWHRGI